MILVVDDIPENVFSLKKVLEHNHFNVDVAFSGEEALKKILTKTYTLVILDVQMPGIDGFEVAENIKGFQKARDTAVIFLSANSTDTDLIVKGYSQGAIDYITKPVDPTILMLKVKTVYDHYEARHKSTQQQQQVNEQFEREKDRNRELSQSMEDVFELMRLAKIATWEYFPQQDELRCSPEVYRLMGLSPNPDQSHLLSVIPVFRKAHAANIPGREEKFEYFQEINHRYLRILGKKEFKNGYCSRVRGLIQDVSGFKNQDQSVLDLVSG